MYLPQIISDGITGSALYQCQDFVFVDSTHNPSLTKSNITKTFGYKSSFYLSFIAHKDSLNDTYLQARKAIYKTYQQIKQEQAQETRAGTTRPLYIFWLIFFPVIKFFDFASSTRIRF